MLVESVCFYFASPEVNKLDNFTTSYAILFSTSFKIKISKISIESRVILQMGLFSLSDSRLPKLSSSLWRLFYKLSLCRCVPFKPGLHTKLFLGAKINTHTSIFDPMHTITFRNTFI